MRIGKLALVSKEGHGEARDVARDIALKLLNKGFSITAFPNLHVKGLDHVSSIRDFRSSQRFDLLITVSGDGTILRVLRTLDNTIPCLCVNVGGRGILAEVKPDQAEIAIERIETEEFRLERRLRISGSIQGGPDLPPALNEAYVVRQSLTRTPVMTLELGRGATFSQRMDGLLISTPTGSTGHSYSFGSPFLQGSLESLLLTPIAPIRPFPRIVRDTSSFRMLGSYSLQVVIDGQESFVAEPNTYIVFKRHENDAVFVRFESDGAFRQLRNLGFD